MAREYLEIAIDPEDKKKLEEFLKTLSKAGMRYSYEEIATFVFREGLLHYKPLRI